MSVKAKFVVNSVTETLHWDKSKGNLKTIKLSPVTSSNQDDENAKFYAATPSGHIELATVNANAAAEFELGKQYYVTFDKAE